jgi:hypothetical protein
MDPRGTPALAMRSLDLDTRLAGSDGDFVATLSPPDWKIRGPNGG